MKNILIIVDMQNGFMREQIREKFKEKIKKLSTSKKFDYIFATRFFNSEDSQYIKIFDWHELMSSPQTDLIDGLYYDEVIDKNVYTCVTDEFLKRLNTVNDGTLPEKVYLCGVDTDCCVLKIATDLFEHNVQPIVLMDYCASNGGLLSHVSAKIVMNRLIGEKSIFEGNIDKLDT